MSEVAQMVSWIFGLMDVSDTFGCRGGQGGAPDPPDEGGGHAEGQQPGKPQLWLEEGDISVRKPKGRTLAPKSPKQMELYVMM